MGGSRRKQKKSRAKVRVGLPKKKPNVFKPAFNLPPKLRSLIEQADPSSTPRWDDQASVSQNYKSFGFISNPNLGVRSRNSHNIESQSLEDPTPPSSNSDEAPFVDPLDPGSDLEEDDLKSALGKKRRDGLSSEPMPLTLMQRVYVGRLVEKYGDEYQSMFTDIKLNRLQHSVATLENLCRRYHLHSNINPLIPRRKKFQP